MPDKPLDHYLRMHRSRHCLSQKEVAYLVGCASSATLARYESGAHTPSSLETILAFEIVFGVPTRKMFAGRFQKVEHEVAARAADLITKLRATGASPATTAKLMLLTALVPSGSPTDI
jgi:transcriptional regulator with XRE-family HTH domain